MSERKGPLETLIARWEKSQKSDLVYYLRQAYDAGRSEPARAKCYFCGLVKRCCVMSLSGGFLPERVEHFFVCPACKKNHVQHE